MVVALVLAFCVILALGTITLRQRSIIENFQNDLLRTDTNLERIQRSYDMLSNEYEEALYKSLVNSQKLFDLWSNMSSQLLDYVRISNRFIDRNTSTGLYNKSFHMTKSLTADISFKQALELEIVDAENYLNLMKDIYHTKGVDFLNIKNRLQSEAYRSFYTFNTKFVDASTVQPVPTKGDDLYKMGKESSSIKSSLKDLVSTYSELKERNERVYKHALYR